MYHYIQGRENVRRKKKGKILTHVCGYEKDSETEATDETDAEIIDVAETIDEVDKPGTYDNYPHTCNSVSLSALWLFP